MRHVQFWSANLRWRDSLGDKESLHLKKKKKKRLFGRQRRKLGFDVIVYLKRNRVWRKDFLHLDEDSMKYQLLVPQRRGYLEYLGKCRFSGLCRMDLVKLNFKMAIYCVVPLQSTRQPSYSPPSEPEILLSWMSFRTSHIHSVLLEALPRSWCAFVS